MLGDSTISEKFTSSVKYLLRVNLKSGIFGSGEIRIIENVSRVGGYIFLLKAYMKNIMYLDMV